MDEGFAFDEPSFVCPADLDGNCVLELFDFLAFQYAFNAGCDWAELSCRVNSTSSER